MRPGAVGHINPGLRSEVDRASFYFSTNLNILIRVSYRRGRSSLRPQLLIRLIVLRRITASGFSDSGHQAEADDRQGQDADPC